MKKSFSVMVALVMTLSLAACGGTRQTYPSAEPTAADLETPRQTATPEVTVAPIESVLPQEGEPLSDAEIEAARQAAVDYYAGTVFEVTSLTALTPDTAPFWEGEIVFRTVCSKSGEAQPDRSIALERQNGVWTVINEGY